MKLDILVKFFICPTNVHNSYKIVKLLKIVYTYNIGTVAAATVPITSNNDICDRYEHCNFSEAQAESSLMMVYVNRNMLE